jgi:hypothetical protein
MNKINVINYYDFDFLLFFLFLSKKLINKSIGSYGTSLQIYNNPYAISGIDYQLNIAVLVLIFSFNIFCSFWG